MATPSLNQIPPSRNPSDILFYYTWNADPMRIERIKTSARFLFVVMVILVLKIQEAWLSKARPGEFVGRRGGVESGGSRMVFDRH